MKFISKSLSLAVLAGAIFSSQSYADGNYKGDLKWVFCDSKQFLINVKKQEEGGSKQGVNADGTVNKDRIKNFLDGCENLGVNAMRMPIFGSEKVTPFPNFYNAFYDEVKKRGLPIYANPAEFKGACRIANNVEARATNIPGCNSDKKIDVLVARLKEFTADYDIKWVGPLNEDGSMSKKYVQKTFKDLGNGKNKVNGSIIVGPDAKLLQKGINMMKNWGIEDYIGVATNHNLGGDHQKWNKFITESLNKNLSEVWDSEANLGQGSNGPAGTTRIGEAVDAGVEGLVLYKSEDFFEAWRKDGPLTEKGKTAMGLYLK